MKTTEVDWAECPPDLDTLFRNYRSRVEAICYRHGIHDVEDAASEIICRFAERGFLDKYDPDYVSVHNGRHYPARFATFMDAFTERYCMGLRDRERRLRRRESLMLNAPIEGDTEIYPEYEDSTPGTEEVDGWLLVSETIRDMQAQVATLPKTQRRDLSKFFDAMLAQILAGETTVNREALADQMKVSVASVGNWVYQVREATEPWADRLR